MACALSGVSGFSIEMRDLQIESLKMLDEVRREIGAYRGVPGIR